jgi:hypothetical protein
MSQHTDITKLIVSKAIKSNCKNMKKQYTQRGFVYYEFNDFGGNLCNIQKSSSVEDCIWVGSKNIGMKGFVPGGLPESWRDITDAQIKEKMGVQDIVANNRMHLNREQVVQLLPILQKFVDTGEI